MMSGGAALEAWAAGRARRELRLLVERAPRIAHRHGAEGVEEVPVETARAGRPRRRAGRRDHPCGREGRGLGCRRRPVGADGGAPARDGSRGRGGAVGDVERRERLRRTRDASGIRERVRGGGAAGADGGERPRTVHAARRPLCGDLPPVHARGRGTRVGSERRPRAGTGGDGRCNAVPAHSRGTHRVRRRALAGGEGRSHREGRRRARAPRIRYGSAPRQDRHRHERRAGRGADRAARGDGRGRDPPPRRSAGSALGARPCRRASSAPRLPAG